MDFSSVALTNTPSNASDPFSHSPSSTFGIPSAYVGVSTSAAGSTANNNNSINNASLPVVNSTGGDPFEDSLEEGHVFGQGRSAAVGPQGMAKLRRDSIAHSQGMGGVSWGSLTIGSWLRDEVMFHATLKSSRSNSSSKTTVHLYPPSSSSQATTRRPSHPINFTAGSPPAAYNAYLPNLEKQYCKDYSCCGLSLPGLHDLLRHYEEAHIATSPNSNLQVSGPSGSSKKRFYRQQNSSDAATAIPRQQQQLTSHQNQFQQQEHHPAEVSQQLSTNSFRKANLQQQGLPQHQQHIIQQQLSPRSTMAASAANMRGSGSPAPLCNPGAAGSDQPQGPQLHLNGSLVDAVSTNDVFLQSGGGNNSSTSRGSSPISRHLGSKQQRRSIQQPQHRPHQYQSSLYHSHSQEQDARSNVVQQNTDIHQKNKVPLTPQHSFNAYSLQGGKNSNKRVDGNVVNVNNKPITQQSNGPSNMSNNKAGSNKFIPNMSTGLELDFMDEDIVGSDMDEAAFMRLTSASPQSGIPLPSHSSSSTSSRFASMTVLNSINHSTPPTSSAALVEPLVNATSMVVEDDVDEDEDEDEDEVEDEDEDMSGANSQSKTLQNSFRRQEAYIDDPARRLYVMDHEEHKPFKCPVIGCDKTYKNQNGLKYHKLHGHQNQKLYENPDGTFSIIDPESNEPYPDGMGYEKDKPYRCEVCGKRYKNLNGLKYHRGHSTH